MEWDLSLWVMWRNVPRNRVEVSVMLCHFSLGSLTYLQGCCCTQTLSSQYEMAHPSPPSRSLMQETGYSIVLVRVKCWHVSLMHSLHWTVILQSLASCLLEQHLKHMPASLRNAFFNGLGSEAPAAFKVKDIIKKVKRSARNLGCFGYRPL